MRNVLFAFMAMIALNAFSASKEPKIDTSGLHAIGVGKAGKPFQKSAFDEVKSSPSNNRASLKRSNEEDSSELPEVKVTCHVTFDPSLCQPANFYVYNSTVKKEFFSNGENTEIAIPAGKYDMMATFQQMNPNSLFGTWGQTLVILENIEVSDGSTVEFDASQATEHISFRTLNPEGKPHQLPLVEFTDEQGNYTIVDSGNCMDFDIHNQIFHEDYGSVYFRPSNCAGMRVELGKFGEWDGERTADYYVNKTSDKYIFQQFRLVAGKDRYAAVVMATRGGKNAEIVNDPKDYFKVEEEFAKTPFGEKSEIEYELPYLVRFWTEWNHNADDVVYGVNSSLSAAHHLDFCMEKTPVCDKITNGVNFKFVDGVTIETIMYPGPDGMEETEVEVPYTIEGSKHHVFGADKIMVVAGIGDYGHSLLPGGDYDRSSFPVAEGFLMNYDDLVHPTGATLPLALVTRNEIAGYWNDPFSIAWVGQKGELRTSDNIMMQVELKRDGSKVASSLDEIKTIAESNDGALPKGQYELYVSNKNITLDKIGAEVKAQVLFESGKEDALSPELRMMQIRNSEGKLTHFVDNESVINFAGGDFMLRAGSETEWGYTPTWYECEKAEWKIEICQHGSNDYRELEVTEIPENYAMPGFGYYYRAALTNLIAGEWYDVRISAIDESGNRQVQEFLPAFLVESGSGIDNVKVSDKIDMEKPVEVYNIHGMRVNIDKGIDCLDPGIYVIRQSTVVMKAIVK